MTESLGDEPGSALFTRIRQLVNGRGVDIRQTLNNSALLLEFADGQRIVVNFDVQTHKVWLAARSGGMEFVQHNGTWRAHDQTELFARLQDIIEQTIASNPLNARAPVRQVTQAARTGPIVRQAARESRWLRNLFIVSLAAGLGFWAAHRLSQPQMPPGGSAPAPAKTVPPDQADRGQQCETGFPANGSVTVFPENGLRAGGPTGPEITLKNDHPHPVLLILTAPQTAIPSMSVLVHARQSTTLQLPAGQYDMIFSVGRAWCNARRGFSDGHFLKFDKPLTVQAERAMQLVLQSSGAGIEDFQLFIKTEGPELELPQPTFTGDGSMEVKRHANGHFYLPGSIENVPVTFMVDTGASVTSISSDVARQAGIRNCREMQFKTANGTATGCIALVPRMTLGNFELQNITVAVMPNMETNLLGANVLRNFEVGQSDSSMLIGRR